MFLKTWQGVTSGTLGGRDDGYPEIKYRVYDSVEQLARDYGTSRDEKYFILTPVDADEIEHKVKQAKEANRVRNEELQRRKDEDEFVRLKNKLGK